MDWGNFRVLISFLIFSLPLIYQYKQLVTIKEGRKSKSDGIVFSQVFLLYFLMAALFELYLIFLNPPPDDCVDCALVLYIMPPIIIGLGLFAGLIVNALIAGAKLK